MATSTASRARPRVPSASLRQEPGLTLPPAQSARPRLGCVLLISEDRELVRGTSETLGRAGYEVVSASGVRSAARALASRTFSACVLDLSGGRGDEVDFCRRIVADPHGVVTLTAPEGQLERIISLEIGADDSVSKPVHPRELLARVRAVLRRTQRAESDAIEFSGWSLDLRAKQLRAPDGSVVPLTEANFSLLKAFTAHPEETLGRERLSALVGEPDASARMIDWRVSRLRIKLDRYERGGNLIKSVQGRGYYFDSAVRRA